MVGRPKKHLVFKGALNTCAIKGAFLPRKGKKKKKRNTENEDTKMCQMKKDKELKRLTSKI